MKRRLKISFFVFQLSFLLLATACSNTPGNKKYDPQKVNFNVQLNPLFDSQLYPSLILGLNSTTASPQGTEAAQQLYTFSVTVTAPSDNALLRVIVDSSIFNYVTTFEEILPRKGETYTFYPPLNWKYDRLATLRQSRPIDLAFTCFVNDEQIITRNLHLNLRTVNECPLSFQHGSRHIDTRWLFAAFVNEDHPYIEQILSDILSQGIVSRISGYQNGSKAAREQAFAVWYYALNRGISYSSISCTSNPSPLHQRPAHPLLRPSIQLPSGQLHRRLRLLRLHPPQDRPPSCHLRRTLPRLPRLLY